MYFEFRPLGPLFFKNGKAFNMGEDVHAEIVFPPNPSTIHGAVCAAVLEANPSLIDKKNKKSELESKQKLKNLIQIDSIFLATKTNVTTVDSSLYPAPLDMYRASNNKLYYQTHFEKNLMSSSLVNLLSVAKQKKVEIPEGFIEDIHFSSYLDGNAPSINKKGIRYFSRNDIITLEPKLGNKRDQTGKIEEGMLYKIQLQRWVNMKTKVKTSLFVKIIRGGELLKACTLAFGGEGGLSEFSRFDHIQMPCGIYDKTERPDYFKLYFSTPAIFKNGWLPNGFDSKNLNGDWKELKLSIISAFIGKPIFVGGWDMATRKPKPTMKAIPAGSVYYIKNEGNHTWKELEKLESCLSETQANEGYGRAHLAKLDKSLIP